MKRYFELVPIETKYNGNIIVEMEIHEVVNREGEALLLATSQGETTPRMLRSLKLLVDGANMLLKKRRKSK